MSRRAEAVSSIEDIDNLFDKLQARLLRMYATWTVVLALVIVVMPLVALASLRG